jgi:hypothetical protein
MGKIKDLTIDNDITENSESDLMSHLYGLPTDDDFWKTYHEAKEQINKLYSGTMPLIDNYTDHLYETDPAEYERQKEALIKSSRLYDPNKDKL